MYLCLLSDAGAPALCADVNDVAAMPAGGHVVCYKLSERLMVILAALRAKYLDSNEVKRGTGKRSALSEARSSGELHSHSGSPKWETEAPSADHPATSGLRLSFARQRDISL